jgi:hypothetical protein
LVTSDALADYEMVKALGLVLQIGYIRAGLAKKPVQISIRVEGFEISGALTGPNELNRDATLTLDGQSNAALC